MAAEAEMVPEENKSFSKRLWELPVAMAAVEQLSNIYSAVKERNAVTRMACNAGESTIQMASAASKPLMDAASSLPLAKPIVGKVECAAATIDHVASETLAKVEEKCPIITKTPQEIKDAVTSAASQYYGMVQNNPVIKLAASKTETVLSFSEYVADLALPTDGNCEEDVKEVETDEQDREKGALVRAKNLTHKVTRRGKRKLMSYQPVKFAVNVVGDEATSVKGHATDLLGKTTDTGKKVFESYMYIPNMALQLSGQVIVSAENVVFALNKAHIVGEMPAALMNMTKEAMKPLSEVKDKLVGHLFVPPQVMAEYVLSSRAVQWIIPQVVANEDMSKMEITMEEIQYSTESEGNENEKEQSY